jgi:hypothetical protein
MIARDSGRVGSNWVLDSAASLMESRLPAFSRVVEHDGPWLEQVRIEGATRPLQDGGALGMPTITNGLQELRVPRRAADFFWRTRARAANAARIRTFAGGQEFFKFEDVLPVIPEVVPIPDRIRPIRQVPRDRDLPAGQSGPFIRHFVIGCAANALHPTGLRIDDDKLVQVIVLPAHRILNGDVEVPERVPLGHLNPTPD